MRFFCEWMLAIVDVQALAWSAHRRLVAAERRTIAALSGSAEAFGEEPAVPSRRLARRRLGAQHRDLLVRRRASPAWSGLVREIVFAALLRHDGLRVGVHDRLAGTEPRRATCSRTRRCRRRSCRCSRDLLQKGRKREAFRLASTLFWIMLIGARRDHRGLHPRGRVDHAAVHRPQASRAADAPDRRPVTGAVPGRAAAGR